MRGFDGDRLRASDARGASAVEYSLIVVAIAALIVAVVFVLGGVVLQQYNDSCNTIEGTMQTGTEC